MTDQQNHLKSLLDQRNNLNSEIANLNNTLSAKREMFLKIQGVVEYLSEIGVTLPENQESLKEESEVKETTVSE
jgi:hypothetical protein